MTKDEKSTERAAQYDGDTRESRAAFRNYDSVSEPVSKRTPWQIWRDACAWQFAALAQEAQAARHVGNSQFERWYASYIGDNPHTPKKQLCRDGYAAGMGDTGAARQSVPAQPVAI